MGSRVYSENSQCGTVMFLIRVQGALPIDSDVSRSRSSGGDLGEHLLVQIHYSAGKVRSSICHPATGAPSIGEIRHRQNRALGQRLVGAGAIEGLVPRSSADLGVLTGDQWSCGRRRCWNDGSTGDSAWLARTGRREAPGGLLGRCGVVLHVRLLADLLQPRFGVNDTNTGDGRCGGPTSSYHEGGHEKGEALHDGLSFGCQTRNEEPPTKEAPRSG